MYFTYTLPDESMHEKKKSHRLVAFNNYECNWIFSLSSFVIIIYIYLMLVQFFLEIVMNKVHFLALNQKFILCKIEVPRDVHNSFMSGNMASFKETGHNSRTYANPKLDMKPIIWPSYNEMCVSVRFWKLCNVIVKSYKSKILCYQGQSLRHYYNLY